MPTFVCYERKKRYIIITKFFFNSSQQNSTLACDQYIFPDRLKFENS